MDILPRDIVSLSLHSCILSCDDMVNMSFAKEWDGNLGVQRESRPRSAFISDSRGSSPKALSKSLNNDYMIVPPPKSRLDGILYLPHLLK